MNIERNREGAWAIYATTNWGYLIQRQYHFYSKRDAMRLFRQELKQINKGDNQCKLNT
jgi:hypothetical protein